MPTILNEEQRCAVAQKEGPVIIKAGAGAGKTRVLTTRAGEILDQRLGLLFCTFTNKAAGEMRARLSETHENSIASGLAAISTLHSFAWRHIICSLSSIDELGPIGRTEGIRIARRDEMDGFIDTAWRNVPKEAQKVLMAHGLFARHLVSCLGITSAYGVAADKVTDEAACSAALQAGYDEAIADVVADILPAFGQTMETQARAANVIDFDGLLVHSLRILQERADVTGFLRDRYPYVQVDEFQDTNEVQLHIVTEITGKGGNCCVVGDDRQAIYSFRGADTDIFDKFKDKYRAAVTLELRANYRSTKAVVDVANACARSMPDRKRLGRTGDMLAGKRRLMPAKPQWWRFNDGISEATGIVDELKRLPKGQSALVLYRSRLIKTALELVLQEEGVDYDILEDVDFFDLPEIRWALDMIRAAIHIDARYPWIQTLSRVSVRLSRDNANKQWDQGGYATLEAEAFKGGGKEALKALLRDFSSFRDAMREAESGSNVSLKAPGAIKQRLDSMWHQWLEASFEKTQKKKFDQGEDVAGLKARMKSAARRLDLLFEIIQRVWWKKRRIATVMERIESYGPKSGNEDRQLARVVLSTVHGAKGLEADHVIYLGGADVPAESPAVSDEDRRVFYVAVTRPRTNLIITEAQLRAALGESSRQRATSSFITELGDSIDFHDCTHTRARIQATA